MNDLTSKNMQGNKLIFYGLLLFLIGLIIGMIVPVFANPRLGVSSHIEGVLNGIFLIVIGLVWHKVELSLKWLNITFYLAIYGTFVNCFGILIAAIFNAGKMLGIASNGQEGAPLVEGIVSFCLISLSIAMLLANIILLVGMKRNLKQVHRH